jgi:hypothetical protein
MNLLRWVDGYGCDESVSALGQRLNESRVVAKGSPNLRQAIRQTAIEIDMRLRAPNVLAQFLARDEFARTRKKYDQYSRGLPFERQWPPVLLQLAGIDVEIENPKPVNHVIHIMHDSRYLRDGVFADGGMKYAKQTGGRGQYGGSIPKESIKPVCKAKLDE